MIRRAINSILKFSETQRSSCCFRRTFETKIVKSSWLVVIQTWNEQHDSVNRLDRKRFSRLKCTFIGDDMYIMISALWTHAFQLLLTLLRSSYLSEIHFPTKFLIIWGFHYLLQITKKKFFFVQKVSDYLCLIDISCYACFDYSLLWCHLLLTVFLALLFQ